MNFLIDCVLDNKNSGIITNHKEGLVLDANNNSDKEESGGEGNFGKSVGNESDYNKGGWSCCG